MAVQLVGLDLVKVATITATRTAVRFGATAEQIEDVVEDVFNVIIRQEQHKASGAVRDIEVCTTPESVFEKSDDEHDQMTPEKTRQVRDVQTPVPFWHTQVSEIVTAGGSGGEEYPKELIGSPSKSNKSKKHHNNSQGLMSESNNARSGVQIFETGKGGMQQMNTTGFHHRTLKSNSKDKI